MHVTDEESVCVAVSVVVMPQPVDRNERPRVSKRRITGGWITGGRIAGGRIAGGLFIFSICPARQLRAAYSGLLRDTLATFSSRPMRPMREQRAKRARFTVW